MAHVLVVCILVAALLLAIGPCQATVEGITAIYNFGDSLSDTGNFIREGAVGMMQYTGKLPYGITINRATGRCSDGYLMIDDLAKDLGLPLLSPYLDKGADFTHGANFAVTGATALGTPALARRGVDVLHTNSSLGVQLQWFEHLMGATTRSPQEVRAKLGESLVLVGEIGGNDYNYAFLVNKKDAVRMTIGAVEAMGLVPEVVQSILNASNALLEMGATRMVIPGNFPIGCAPGYLSAVGEQQQGEDPAPEYDGEGCLVALNLFAQTHNVLLQRGIQELREAYPAATIAYADYFAAYLQMLGDARKLGFDGDGAGLAKACCGVGGGKYNVDLDRMCGAPGTTVCGRPYGFISWDGIHLTQHAYRVLTDLLYHQGFASPAPVDFSQSHVPRS